MLVISGLSQPAASAAAEYLLARREGVKVVVNDYNQGRSWSMLGAREAYVSLNDTASLASALEGADGFLAVLDARLQTVHDELFLRQKELADSIAEAVKASGVPRVVLLSSIGADLDSGNGEIRGLNYFESALRKTGSVLTILRPGYLQEEATIFLQDSVANGTYLNFFSSADFALPMIAAADVGLCAAQALLDKSTKSEIIDLAGPSYTIRQAANLLGRALGKELQIIDVPAASRLETLMEKHYVGDYAKTMAERYAGFAAGRFKPRGNRFIQGATDLRQTVAAIVGAAINAQKKARPVSQPPEAPLPATSQIYCTRGAEPRRGVTEFGYFSKAQSDRLVDVLSAREVEFFLDEATDAEDVLRRWGAWDEAVADPTRVYGLSVRDDNLDRLGTIIFEMFPERLAQSPFDVKMDMRKFDHRVIAFAKADEGGVRTWIYCLACGKDFKYTAESAFEPAIKGVSMFGYIHARSHARGEMIL